MRYAVALAADNNYTQHFCVTVRSLLENNKDIPFDIYLLNEGLSSENREKVDETIKEFDVVFHNIVVDDSAFQGLHLGTKHLTIQTFFRLLIPNLIQAERVLYLDCDIVVTGDLKDLFITDFEDNYILAIQDTFTPYVEDAKKILGMSKDALFFNAGVMVVNMQKWKEDNLATKILDFAVKNPDKIQYADQDSLNAVIDGRWKEMPLRYNIQYSLIENKLTGLDLIEKENVRVIHYTGSYCFKPWNLACLNPYKNKYWEYLRRTPFRNYRATDYLGWIKYKIIKPIIYKFYHTLNLK